MIEMSEKVLGNPIRTENKSDSKRFSEKMGMTSPQPTKCEIQTRVYDPKGQIWLGGQNSIGKTPVLGDKFPGRPSFWK